ncbi:FecR family protein [Pukyongiella litopenaei]|nr:FecR family protein [Pukyongiella litopenaei]
MATEPARQVMTCDGTLIVEREPGTSMTIDERAGAAPPRAIEIEGGAILIDVQPGTAPTQIRTPHAIAAVRGTTYVVDAGAQRTSVFVIAGRVEVRKLDDGSDTVQLRPGQGTDVTATDRLEVKRWDADRAARLLARFGR